MLLPLVLAGGAGAFVTDQFRKAGERKEIKDLLKKQNMAENYLGSPTGGFSGGTGFGPNMVFNPLGSYQNILRYQTQMGDQQRDQMVKNLLAIEPITDRAKARDFERNMSAARFRTQLGTQQGLTLQGQLGAQKLAQQGMQGATTALASNYQYQ
jgi:hypothetical protein